MLGRFGKDGKLSEDLIDNAVRHILTVKFKLGLFDNDYASPEQIEKKVRSAEK